MKRVAWFLLVLLTACAGDTEPVSQIRETTVPEHDQNISAPAATPKEIDVGDKTKPKIEVPDGDPPKKLVIEDIEEGDGARAKPGATVTIHYSGVSYSTGKEFDSSWTRGEPITFPLGQLIPGWQEGIPGMKEGGRRQLTIPPDLAYGAEGRPPLIKGGETLIFIIDLFDADA